MAKRLTRFDPADALTSGDAIAAFMAEAVTSNDETYIAHALSLASRAEDILKRSKRPMSSVTKPKAYK